MSICKFLRRFGIPVWHETEILAFFKDAIEGRAQARPATPAPVLVPIDSPGEFVLVDISARRDK